jgi:hypothetical protein
MSSMQKALVAGAVALLAWHFLKKKSTSGVDAAAATVASPPPIPAEAASYWKAGNEGPPPLSPDEIAARQYWAEDNIGPPPASSADAFKSP